MVGAMEVADANIGRDAVYAADGGAPRVTYVWSPAGRRTGFGEARLRSESTRMGLRVAEVPTPRPAPPGAGAPAPSASQ